MVFLMRAAMSGSAPRAIVSARRNSPLAMALFALAYVGILVVIFAPEGTFVSPPASVQAER